VPPDKEIATLLECFSSHEQALLRQLLASLPKLPADARDDALRTLRQAARSIPFLVQAIDANPIAGPSQHLGGRVRDAESLLESLCQEEWLPSDFSIPTGAVVKRAYLLARINFLKALKYSIATCTREQAAELPEALQEVVDDGIFAKLAEELLTAAVANPLNPLPLRRAAARKLLGLWSDPSRQPVGEFPKVLLSAWRARRRIKVIYGTLFGVDEVLSLIREQCEDKFLNFFSRDQVTTDQVEAFREFLFALSHEDLKLLEAHMQAEGLKIITRDQVYRLLGKSGPPATAASPTAEEIFASYYRRRVRAEFRAMSKSSGPHKTAEGYLMESLLREGGQDAEGPAVESAPPA
jgi:hypothetical protein